MRDVEHEQHRHQAPHAPAPQEARPEAARPGGARPPAPGRSPALSPHVLLSLQRTAGNRGVVQMLADDEQPSPVHGVVGKGGGAPLDTATRSSMESAFGRSFSDVRVHTDDKASASADAVGANAYTVGNDVVFKSGQFNPGSPEGQKTLAHELTHVVQQSKGPVSGTPSAGGIAVSDPGDSFEREADAHASQVMAKVQRQAEDEEEEEQR